MDEQNMQPIEPKTGGNAAKWIIGIIVLALIVWAVMASKKKNAGQQATNTNTNQTASDTYKIGVLLPLTGDAGSYGEVEKDVYQIGVDEINNSGGVNGKKLELVIEDSKCNGKDATNAAQKLVNENKVQVIIGGFCSGESLAGIPVAAPAKVIMASPGSSSPKLTNASPYFFRDFPSDDSQASLDAQIANKKGFKKVAFIQEQTDYAKALYDAFDKKFTELGGQTVKEEFVTGNTDFKTQLTKLRAQNPEALFLDTQTSGVNGRIFRQLKDLGWKPQLFINEAMAGDIKALADNKELLEGAIGAEFTVDAANTKFSMLAAKYKEKYGKDLSYGSYAQTGYDLVYIFKDGITAVGYDGEKLAAWSRTIKNWEGASGKITIKPDGDRESGYSSEMVKDGKMVPYTQ